MQPWTLASLLSVFLAVPAAADPLGPAEWLVDLGRDYPLSLQAGLSDADARITLLFMEAATRVAPELAEPHLWCYDMLSALGRVEEARAALGRYVERAPDEVGAHLNWIALSVEALQTADARADFCRAQLQRPGLPGPVASDLHRRLAEFHHERGEVAQARSAAQAAVQAYELNFAARDLVAELAESPQDPNQHTARDLKESLLRLTASPGQISLAMVAADSLMLCNLPAEAERLYGHAAALAEEIEAEVDLALARSAQARALSVLGREDEARSRVKEARTAWQVVLAASAGRIDPELVAEMAWFFAGADPQPGEAARLARSALAERPDSVVARRALGAALRQQGRPDEAREALVPIIEQDAWAAIEYAKLLYDAGRKDEAAEQLRAVSTQPAGADQRRAIAERLSTWNLPPPASRPAPAEARTAVDGFPWAVLEYPLAPEKYLSLTWRMVGGKDLAPAEPWRLAVQLKNTGSFPITFGPGMMVVPDLLVMIETTGDRPRSSGPTIQLSLTRRLRLMPGEAVETTQTIDVGSVRAGMIGTPQVEHEVIVRGILSPVAFLNERGQEVWLPAVGGLAAEPLWFRRTAVPASPEDVRGLIDRSGSGPAAQRIQAMETLAMLLAESQHLAAGRLKYAARRIDAEAVQAALLARSGDSEWHVRARLDECLRWFTLDSAAASTTARLLSDPHWLVRGLAFRVLADHYDHAFEKVRPVLTRAAEADPDEWVKRMAQALLDRKAAASTPETESGTTK